MNSATGAPALIAVVLLISTSALAAETFDKLWNDRVLDVTAIDDRPRAVGPIKQVEPVKTKSPTHRVVRRRRR